MCITDHWVRVATMTAVPYVDNVVDRCLRDRVRCPAASEVRNHAIDSTEAIDQLTWFATVEATV